MLLRNTKLANYYTQIAAFWLGTKVNWYGTCTWSSSRHDSIAPTQQIKKTTHKATDQTFVLMLEAWDAQWMFHAAQWPRFHAAIPT